jgi:hypothetical protein
VPPELILRLKEVSCGPRQTITCLPRKTPTLSQAVWSAVVYPGAGVGAGPEGCVTLNVASWGRASSVYGIFATQNLSHNSTIELAWEDELVGAGEAASPDGATDAGATGVGVSAACANADVVDCIARILPIANMLRASAPNKIILSGFFINYLLVELLLKV